MTGFDLILYGALCATAAGPAQSGPLTIDQAVAIAESRAFAVRLEQSGLLRENSTVRLAESQLGPQVTGSISASRSGQATSFGNVAGGTGGQTLFSNNSVAYGVSLDLPLDFSGALHANLRSAEAARRSQRQNLLASINDTRLNARTAFLNLLRAKASVGVQEASLRNAQAQAEQARLQLEQVQVAKIDVDRLNAQVAQRQSDLVDARNQYELAAFSLNYALARPIDTPVDPVDVTDLPTATPDPTSLDQTARSARPETRAARETVESFAQIRAAAEHLNVPNVSLTLSDQRSGSGLEFGGFSKSASLGLSLSVPLFDSGNIRARVGQARQDEEQARIRLAQTELGVSQDVRNAFSNLTSARARLDNATRQVDLAQEVYRIAQVRQSAGAGTYVEVVDAETTLTTARQNYVRARYDVLTAYSQLQRAVGDDRLATTPAPIGASRP